MTDLTKLAEQLDAFNELSASLAISEAARILRSAAVDVAGLMALVKKATSAHYLLGLASGEWRCTPEHHADKDAADAALESALRLALAAREGWQPIETAPKDGTDILLAIIDADHSYIDHVERGYFEVVAEDEEDGPWDIRDGEPWCSYEGRPEGLYWCYACAPDDFNRRGIRFLDSSDCLKYTHWMPLPAAAPKGTT